MFVIDILWVSVQRREVLMLLRCMLQLWLLQLAGYHRPLRAVDDDPFADLDASEDENHLDVLLEDCKLNITIAS